MGILEPEFRKLHWPPLVREVVITAQHPGYRHEFFKSFRELDAYFRATVHDNWRQEAWAEFWIGQHKETQNDDRRDLQTVKKKTRARPRDMLAITRVAIDYLNVHSKVSSYKLCEYLKTCGISIDQKSAWRIIKRWKNKPDELILDHGTGRYLSDAYLHDVVTPLGEQIPTGYTKKQWREDWNKKYNL